MPDATGSDDTTAPTPAADASDTADAGTAGADTAGADTAGADTAGADAMPDGETGPGPDLKNSYKEALARKTGRNSHAEQHLIGRRVGGGNNDTHKRTFRRKSG